MTEVRETTRREAIRDRSAMSASVTLVVRSRVTLFPFPGPRVIAQGTWEIVGATGAYAGLEGDGKSLAVGDFTTASVTIMRDGQVKPGNGQEERAGADR
jgi:hypothetical protein